VLRLVASPDAAQGSVQVHANARMYAGCFEPGQRAHLALDPQRKAYVQVLRGSVHANGHFLDTGDALLMPLLAPALAVRLTELGLQSMMD